MAKKIRTTNYPYIVVEGVENRLLDYALIHSIHNNPAYTINNISVDAKLMNKIKKQKGEMGFREILVIAYNLSNYYNTYNSIVGKLMEEIDATADEKFEQYTSDDFEQYFIDNYPEETIIKEQLDYVCEMLVFFRLYKKGRYANEYIPLIVKCLKEEFIPNIVALFEDSAAEIEWIDAMVQYFEELEAEFEELDELDDVDVSSVQALKSQMLKLIDQFSEKLNITDPKELENLQSELDEKNQELKSVSKQLKNKDEQISKLQKGVASKDKEFLALSKKFDELKKLEGAKNAELSSLRKTAKEATENYEQLLKRQETYKDSMQKELAKARELATQPLQLQLNDLKDRYEMKIEKLEENYAQLQQTVREEREELHKLEDEADRLRQFQTYYDSLNAENVKLQTENERLQKELEELKKTLQQNTLNPTPVAPVLQEPQQMALDDVELIDETIFGIVANLPEESRRESESAHIVPVAVAPQKNEQSGAIGVVKDEDEINFEDLLMNRPE